MRARGHAWLTGALLALAAAAPLGAAAEDLAVIVHPSRGAALDADQIAQIYLMQRRRWPEGGTIVPVNREPDSAERKQFARAVLGQTPQQLAVYWNRQYFHGVQPPPTLASEEAVKRFVAREPRAIGYVRVSALDASVRVALRLPVPLPPPSR